MGKCVASVDGFPRGEMSVCVSNYVSIFISYMCVTGCGSESKCVPVYVWGCESVGEYF